MFIDKQHFERWMHHLEERLDRIEKLCVTLSEPKPSILPEGEKLLDNAEMCRMLNISKRLYNAIAHQGYHTSCFIIKLFIRRVK